MGESITTSDLGETKKYKPPARRKIRSITTKDIDLKRHTEALYHRPETRYLHQTMPSGSWKGRRCFIVGGGPSLRGFDFSCLRGELVITVNRGLEVYPDSTINLCQDARLWGWWECGDLGAEAKEKFDKYEGQKVWLDVQRFPYPEDIRIIRTCNYSDFDYKNYANGIPPFGNAGLNALCLASCLGASEIYLLGFDCKGEDGRTANFHAGYPDSSREDVYKGFVKDFAEVAFKLKAGSRIINLNPDSAIRSFEFGRIEDIKRIERPLYVSYYSAGTGYEFEIQRLHDSLHRWGLEHEFVAIEDKGTWRKNIHERIRVLRGLLDRFQRNIVYIDADGAVIHYPELLDGIEEDFAAVWLDREKYFPRFWKKGFYGEQPAGKWEILGGTMFFRNNDRARAMLDAWEKLDAPMDTHLSQVHLFNAIKSVPEIRVLKMPDGYCQIFDIMAKAGEPVIEHYQASRRCVYRVKVDTDGRKSLGSAEDEAKCVPPTTTG